MWRSFTVIAALCAVACGGSSSVGVTNPPPKPKALDPAISIHVMNRLDASTAIGRAQWNTFALIYSPDDPAKAGVSLVGGGPAPMGQQCVLFQADSIGARYVIVLSLADTLHGIFSQDPQRVANTWYGGNHTLPAGWAALATDSLDWGISTQFTQGHGLTQQDPVRWSLTWTSPATVTRAEAPNDLTCT